MSLTTRIKVFALTAALLGFGGLPSAQAQDWTDYLHWPYVPPQVPGNGFEYNALHEAWRDAPEGEAKLAAATALDDWARGTTTRPGLANWGGITGAVSAIFAVPVGLLTLILVSLVTRPRRMSSLLGGPSQP